MDYKETAPQAHLVSHLKSCSDGSAVSGQPDRLATWWRGFESGRWWKKMFEKNYISVETSSRCHFWPRCRFRFRIGASFEWISKVSENQRSRKSKLFDAKQSFVKTEQLSESDAARKKNGLAPKFETTRKTETFIRLSGNVTIIANKDGGVRFGDYGKLACLKFVS